MAMVKHLQGSVHIMMTERAGLYGVTVLLTQEYGPDVGRLSEDMVLEDCVTDVIL